VYEKFFSLNVKPFELVPNPDFLYLSGAHKKALTYLKYGISENIGFILLTGEVGSGKTTIIRDLIKNLNGNVVLAKVFNTKVTSNQLISLINEDFGLDVSGKKKVTLLRDLNDFLIDQHTKKRQPILVIDEAQNLSSDLLEEIRMLSNLETNMSKLLQIVLVGQPELRSILAMPELRQLRQRISISCHIPPLLREETESYIFHRLERAGGKGAVLFHDGTMDIIHEFARGIPRLVNIMCDFLLLSAFSEGKKEISVHLAREIVREMEMENQFWVDEAPRESRSSDRLGELSARIGRIEADIRKQTLSRKEEEKLSVASPTGKIHFTGLINQLSSRLWEMEVKIRNLAMDFYTHQKRVSQQQDSTRKK